MSDRFRAVDNVETELSRLYSSGYEKIWKEYNNLTKSYLNPDGTLDYGRLESALKLDAKLNRKSARYSGLLRRIDNVVDGIGVREELSIEKLLMETYKINYYETLHHIEQGLGFKTEFSLLSPDRLKQIVHTSWTTDGVEFSSRIWDNKRKLNKQLRILIQDGMTTGKSPLQTARLLRKEMGGQLYCSKRIIRTETLSMITESDRTAYSEIGFSEYKILSTFDKRTSAICQLMDGRVFSIKDMKIATNAPPFHPNCRSTIEPITEYTPAIRFAKDINNKRVSIPLDMSFEDFKILHLIPQD